MSQDKKDPIYKKFTWLLVVSLFSLGIVIISIINIIIDPYNEYRLLSNNSFRSSITTAFPLFDKLNDSRYTLVFGTSTSASVDERCVGDNVLNFSLSLYGEPERIYYSLGTLTSKQISNINRIYYAFEYNSFHENSVTDTDIDFSSNIHFAFRTLFNVQKPKIIASLDWVLKRLTGSYDAYIDEFGIYRQIQKRTFSPVTYSDKITFTHGQRQLRYLLELHRFAKDRNIEFRVMRTVVSHYFLKHVDIDSVYRQYEAIARICPFFSLLWIDGISDDVSFFRDPIHPSFDAVKSELGIMRSAESYKYLVNEDNIEEYFNRLRRVVGDRP